MSENEFLCPDCGKPMTLAPGVDYFCQTPACSKKMREEFWASFRKDHQAELSERATIEDLSRKLEEANKAHEKTRAYLGAEINSKAELRNRFDIYVTEANRALTTANEEINLLKIEKKLSNLNADRGFDAKDARIAELEAAAGRLVHEISSLSQRHEGYGRGEIYKPLILCKVVDEVRAIIKGNAEPATEAPHTAETSEAISGPKDG